MPDIREYIRSYRKILERYIDDYFDDLIRKQTTHSGQQVAALYGIFKEAGRGGKYIRGSLVKLGYEIAWGQPADDAILPASAAFEIFQTSALCHDDIIDKSPLRRGRDSIWKAIARDVDYHYGVSQAICLGDVGLSLSSRLVLDSSFGWDEKSRALGILFDAQTNTMDGEMLDVCMSQKKDYGDEKGVLKISELKTAWYTIVGPLQLGAVLGGASRTLLDAMKRYGLALGIAFQLKDDILGIEATEAEMGKSNTSDIAEGKVTLLAHYAMKGATPDQLRQLRQIYGNDTVSEEDRATVQNIFQSTGAFAEVTRRAETYLAEARGVVSDVTRDPDKTELLTHLCDMMFQRKS
ncbi:MAG: polyprenyl synthetase family protein [Synergistaceae bacterium]|jgi:geranylgeranyl diphosphate synthase type I|nr:polyprenyl synthetase family protein [Synergistaceae bacterium]